MLADRPIPRQERGSTRRPRRALGLRDWWHQLVAPAITLAVRGGSGMLVRDTTWRPTVCGIRILGAPRSMALPCADLLLCQKASAAATRAKGEAAFREDICGPVTACAALNLPIHTSAV